MDDMALVRMEFASERAAVRTQIEEIDAQMVEMERSFGCLQEKRNSLRGRLDTYRYPVLNLPNEVVSEIFVRFLPVYPKRAPAFGPLSPTLLTQICHKWREIALSTPALWRAVALSGSRKWTTKQKVHFLETALERSGSCSLSIDLECLIVQNELASKRQMTPLLRRITSHSARLEHLKLFMDMVVLEAFKGPLPFLRSLKIGSFPSFREFEEPAPAYAFLQAPLLNSVTLQQYRPTLISRLPWMQLTTLSVDFIKPSECAKILNEVDNLVYCKLRIYTKNDVSQSRCVTSMSVFFVKLDTFLACLI